MLINEQVMNDRTRIYIQQSLQREFWYLMDSAYEFMRERLINFFTQASETVNGSLGLQLFQIIGNAKSGNFLAKLESQRLI